MPLKALIIKTLIWSTIALSVLKLLGGLAEVSWWVVLLPAWGPLLASILVQMALDWLRGEVKIR